MTAPICGMLVEGQTLAASMGTLSPEALEFQATCIRAGFGPVMHVKVAQSLADATSYVVKYLHKTGAQRQVETNGSRVRTPNR